ncbi:MAG: hypothetical protein LBU45_00835 [Azoarcus sp.]|jgi:hypothetical protein|nr:hypothetical protein [Azoarcus sp.]
MDVQGIESISALADGCALQTARAAIPVPHRNPVGATRASPVVPIHADLKGRRTHPSYINFRQRIGYHNAIRQEVQDGLILIDFRRIPQPSFMKEWPTITDIRADPWRYGEWNHAEGHRRGYHFSWGGRGSYGYVGIDVGIYNTYEDARDDFLYLTGEASLPFPWNKCPKDIGTVCVMDTRLKEDLFFFYKNVSVRIRPATNDTIAEKTAEWLFKVLKAFPRSPMDAPFKPQEPPFPFRIETP